MSGSDKLGVLNIYASQFEERVNRIERLFKLEGGVGCKNGVVTYSAISEQIHQLKVIVTQMQIILEDEKRNSKQFQVIYFIVMKVQLYKKI